MQQLYGEPALNLRTRNAFTRKDFYGICGFSFLWLGGRDSNPDNGVQSAVSYR